MHGHVLRWRGGDSPYGTPTVTGRDLRSGSEVRAGAGHQRDGRGERGEGRKGIPSFQVSLEGYVSVSGAWIRARKLEGERDVGGRRIV